ncbi:hypothetical protein ACIBSW_22180 [Actinoplanes sp. NPDC049668]|uniref:hypothetical protein n=1 Tax=unclassified Actinoplanes TaxID=2626549 RepID=UPI0033BF20C4
MNPRQAWMALPRRTRLEAVHRAKQGRAHSAAAVRVAAMAWGRYAPRLIMVRVSIGLVVAFAVFLVPLANDWPFPVAVLGLLPMVAVMAGEGYAQRRWEGWHRMLGPVNGRRVLLDQAGTAQPLEVGRSFVARYAVPGYLLLAVAGPAAIELTGGHFGAAVLLAAAAAGLAWRAYRRSRRLARPPLRIDGSGVTFHSLGWVIPWSAIASCDLTDEGDQTVSRQYGAKTTGIAWRLRRKGLEATLAAIPETVRKTVTAWLEHNDYSVVLDSGQLAVPPERLAAASRRYLERSGGGAERLRRSRSRR